MCTLYVLDWNSKLLSGCCRKWFQVVEQLPQEEVPQLLRACAGGGRRVEEVLPEVQPGLCSSFTRMMPRDSRSPQMLFSSWALVSLALLLFFMSWESSTLCAERLRKVLCTKNRKQSSIWCFFFFSGSWMNNSLVIERSDSFISFLCNMWMLKQL